MRIYTYIFLTLSIAFFSCGKKPLKKYSGDLDQVFSQIIKDNHIQSRKKYKGYVNDGKPDTINPELSQVMEFDKNGNILKDAQYYGGDFAVIFTYTYNDKNQKITTEHTNYKSELLDHYDHIYENDLNTIRIKKGPNGERTGTITYTYNKNGDCTMLKSESLDSTSSYRTEYIFNEKGKETGYKHYNYLGILEFESKTILKNDTCYESVSTDMKTGEKTKIKVVFNSQKQVKISQYTKEDGKGNRQEYVYNNNGLLKESWVYEIPGDKVISYEYYKYKKY